nr:hypothetical protein CFP56_22537 [Quercus suber]
MVFSPKPVLVLPTKSDAMSTLVAIGTSIQHRSTADRALRTVTILGDDETSRMKQKSREESEQKLEFVLCVYHHAMRVGGNDPISTLVAITRAREF